MITVCLIIDHYVGFFCLGNLFSYRVKFFFFHLEKYRNFKDVGTTD